MGKGKQEKGQTSYFRLALPRGRFLFRLFLYPFSSLLCFEIEKKKKVRIEAFTRTKVLNLTAGKSHSPSVS
jgi:hypothetical protein